MPLTRPIGVVPPDDPIFSTGPSFVFRNDPPEADVTPEDDVEEDVEETD